MSPKLLFRTLIALPLAAAACDGATAAPGPAAPGPVISTTQAAEVQAAYDARNNEINKVFNAGAIDNIEVPPLASASRAWLKIKKSQKQQIPPLVHTDGTFLIPSEKRFPRWFVSVTRSARGGVPSARLSYTLFVQRAASAPWRASYLAGPTEPVAPVATNNAGAATVVTSADGLALAPAALGAAIFKHYTTRATNDEFARTAALDDHLGGGYNLAKEMYDARGWKWKRTLSKAKQPIFTLRTRDGGALAFTASLVKDVVEPGTESKTVTLDEGSNEAALAGRPSGMTTERLTVKRLQMFLTYIPAKTSGQRIRVLAYSDTPVSVR